MPNRVAENVSITPDLNRFVADRIASGRDRNDGAVMRAAPHAPERAGAAQDRRRAPLAGERARHA